jgi:hypothetical protein
MSGINEVSSRQIAGALIACGKNLGGRFKLKPLQP